MKKETITRTFAFKRAEITGDSGHTLYELIRNALEVLPLADDRKMEIEENSERYRVLNDWRFIGAHYDVCLASIFGFTLNANENAVVLKRNQKSFPVEVLAPKRDAKHHQEFVEGLVWIGVKDDYLAIMTSQSVSFSMLEGYLSDLFSRTLEKTVNVNFVDPTIPRYSDCDMSTVKKLTISNNIDVRESSGSAQTNSIRRHFVPEGGGWQIVKALCNALGVRPPRMILNNEHALDQIDVDVIISTRRPSIEDGNQADALARVADVFKDVDNPPITVEFKDGRKLSLTDYRIMKKFTIPSENKIPKVAEVCEALNKWLLEQIRILSLARVS